MNKYWIEGSAEASVPCPRCDEHTVVAVRGFFAYLIDELIVFMKTGGSPSALEEGDFNCSKCGSVSDAVYVVEDIDKVGRFGVLIKPRLNPGDKMCAHLPRAEVSLN